MSGIRVYFILTSNSPKLLNPVAHLVVVDGITVAATTFLDDSGTAATAFPVVTNGYYNFYLNGVLQEGDSYTISATELTLNTVTGSISAETSLVIEAVELVTVT